MSLRFRAWREGPFNEYLYNFFKSLSPERQADVRARRSRYQELFRTVVAPRLGPVREREPEAPPRFAQLVGLLFAVVGAAGYLIGASLVGAVATGLALVAALLNAATGFCLGCELYLTVRRAQTARTV